MRVSLYPYALSSKSLGVENLNLLFMLTPNCQTWTRTKILSSKGSCPTIRRSGKPSNFTRLLCRMQCRPHLLRQSFGLGEQSLKFGQTELPEVRIANIDSEAIEDPFGGTRE